MQYVSRALRVLVTYMLSCFTYFVPHVSRVSSCLVPYLLLYLMYIVLYVHSWLTCLVSYVLSCLTCFVFNCSRASLVPCVSRALPTLVSLISHLYQVSHAHHTIIHVISRCSCVLCFLHFWCFSYLSFFSAPSHGYSLRYAVSTKRTSLQWLFV